MTDLWDSKTLDAASHVPGKLCIDSTSIGWQSLILKKYQAQMVLEEYEVPEIDDQRVIVFEKTGQSDDVTNCRTRYRGKVSQPIYQDGDITLLGPRRSKKISWCMNKPHTLIHLYLPSDILTSALEDSQSHYDIELLSRIAVRDTLLSTISTSLAQAVQQKLSENYANTAAQFIAMHLLETNGIHLGRPEKNPVSLKKIEKYIEENLASEITNEDLANLIGRTTFQLIRMCNQSWSETPMRRVMRRRIEYAKELLSKSKWEVARISKMCGYSCPSNFTVAFRRETGITPMQWRKL